MKNFVCYAANSLIHHWISKCGPPQNLITDKRTEMPKTEISKCCTLLKITHSPKIIHVAWIDGLVEVQKLIGSHLRMFLCDNLRIDLYRYISLPMLTIINHDAKYIFHLNIDFSYVPAYSPDFSLKFFGKIPLYLLEELPYHRYR